MELNKVHNIDFLNNTLPDKCANLIISDPPYFEVKGDFDFVWETFEDYLVDVEKWAIECKRLLKDNGTLFWYGDSKKIAYSQIIFDKYFKLLSNVTCHIIDRQTNKIPAEEARGFISTTERLLMYSNDEENFVVDHLQKYLLDEFKKYGKPVSFYKNLCGFTGNQPYNWFTPKNNGKAQWAFPTKEHYVKLQNTGFFQKNYDDLKLEYEELRRTFNAIEEYKMDVLRVSQEGHITGKYDHDTVKPEKLTRILLNTCTKKGDTVIVPFAGSGTECAMSVKENCNFYAFEITKKHADMSNKRVSKIMCNPCLPFE
tara:strand:+ start:135 stop:1073 length:939 start_codon:yes stop_codon:yes gene_type:complete